MHSARTVFSLESYIGLVEAGAPIAPDPREVAEVFEVPLAFALDAAATAEDAAMVERLLASVGKSYEVEEPLLDAVEPSGETAQEPLPPLGVEVTAAGSMSDSRRATCTAASSASP